MEKIGIVTDSTAYLPRDLKNRYQIRVVSLSINFENESFQEEGLYENFNEFYEKLKRVTYLPTTSQPSVGDFLETYREMGRHYESIISIHITEGISGTVNNARTAARMLPELDITVIDSRAAAIGEYMLVDAASRAAAAGFTKERIVWALNHIINHMTLYFLPGTLEYLRRGGRIGGAAALLGTLLQIRPILYFNWDKNSIIDLYEKVRTREKGLQRMLEELEKAYRHCPELKTAVVHVGAEEEGLALIERIKRLHPELTPDSCPVGPVVGAHIGPGTLGICCYPVPPQLRGIIRYRAAAPAGTE